MSQLPDSLHVQLTTGRTAQLSATTLQDGIDGYMHLVDTIIMEHLARVNACNEELFGAVTREILHVVESAKPDANLLALVGLHNACFGRLEGFIESEQSELQ